MARYTNESIVPAALRGETAETQNGNFSTTNYASPWWTDQLPQVWARLFRERAPRITQVIYSYSTPIAWHDSEFGWIIPAVTYSVTTSAKHQSHLYRLRGRRVYLPCDGTIEDARRALDGRTVYSPTGTIPGPNYVEGE